MLHSLSTGEGARGIREEHVGRKTLVVKTLPRCTGSSTNELLISTWRLPTLSKVHYGDTGREEL